MKTDELIKSIRKPKKKVISISIREDVYDQFYKDHPKLIFSHMVEALVKAFLDEETSRKRGSRG